MLEWQNPRLHLLPDVNDSTRIVINIEGFKNDLNNAFSVYKGQLLSQSQYRKIAIKHYDRYGILVYLDKEIKISL